MIANSCYLGVTTIGVNLLDEGPLVFEGLKLFVNFGTDADTPELRVVNVPLPAGNPHKKVGFIRLVVGVKKLPVLGERETAVPHA